MLCHQLRDPDGLPAPLDFPHLQLKHVHAGRFSMLLEVKPSHRQGMTVIPLALRSPQDRLYLKGQAPRSYPHPSNQKFQSHPAVLG